MKYATRENTKVGDTVLIPLNGEWMEDEQIMVEHEVVLAFRCKISPDKQIVGKGQAPLPLLREFNDETAFLTTQF